MYDAPWHIVFARLRKTPGSCSRTHSELKHKRCSWQFPRDLKRQNSLLGTITPARLQHITYCIAVCDPDPYPSMDASPVASLDDCFTGYWTIPPSLKGWERNVLLLGSCHRSSLCGSLSSVLSRNRIKESEAFHPECQSLLWVLSRKD